MTTPKTPMATKYTDTGDQPDTSRPYAPHAASRSDVSAPPPSPRALSSTTSTPSTPPASQQPLDAEPRADTILLVVDDDVGEVDHLPDHDRDIHDADDGLEGKGWQIKPINVITSAPPPATDHHEEDEEDPPAKSGGDDVAADVDVVVGDDAVDADDASGGPALEADRHSVPTGHTHVPTAKVPPPLLAMVDALDPDAVREIKTLLEVRLFPVADPSQYRQEELGFLASIMELPEAFDQNSPRATPKRDYYDKHKPTSAPNSQRLTDNYGSWTKACRAARGLTGAIGAPAEPRARAWTHGYTGKRKPADYTRDEIVRAVLHCATAINRIPSSHAYFSWAARRRREAKLKGAPHRLPSTPTVYRHFDSWEAVTKAVQIALEEGGELGNSFRSEVSSELTPARKLARK